MTEYKASPIWTAQPYVKIPADVHVRLAKIAGVPPEEYAAFAICFIANFTSLALKTF